MPQSEKLELRVLSSSSFTPRRHKFKADVPLFVSQITTTAAAGLKTSFLLKENRVFVSYKSIFPALVSFIIISFHLFFISFSYHFIFFFPSFSSSTPPVLFPSSPFLPLCHALLFWLFIVSFHPSSLASYLLYLIPFFSYFSPQPSSFGPFATAPSPLCPQIFHISLFCFLPRFHLPLLPPYPIISTLHPSSPFSNNPV